MKHALAWMLLAGSAGGAAWYHYDQSPRPPVARLRVPDPGLEEELSFDGVPAWEPLDIDLLEPVGREPRTQVAGKSRIQTVSDEQPFAVSEEPADQSPPLHKSNSVRGSEAFETVETRSGREERLTADSPREDDRSVEGRLIGMRKIGQGRVRTLIIAGTDGRDRTAVRWTDDLAEALEAQPETVQQQEILIIRAANPDGLAAKTRCNAHGVDLNRNFPTKRFRPNRQEATGSGPASEPETRALLQAMYDFQPQRVIHICSTAGASLVLANQQAGDAASRLQRRFGLPLERLNYDRLPGSLEEFAEATWSASVMMLQVHGVPEPEIPRKILPVLLASVTSLETGKSASPTATAPVSTPRREPGRWKNGPTSSPVPNAPGYQSEQRRRAVLRRGYEELPPPPQ